MRKKIIVIVLLVVLILVLAVGCGASNRDKANKDYDIIKKKTLEVHNMLEYGDPGELNINKILEGGIGACGSYALLLQYELSKEGYDVKILGISSAYRNAHHSVVEVRDNSGNYYVCDPTNACIYRYSINELIHNPKFAGKVQMLCEENDYISSYMSPDFFASVYNIQNIRTIVQYAGCFYSAQLLDISPHIKEIKINSNSVAIDKVLDNDISTYVLKVLESDDEVSIEIELSPTAFSVLGVNFLGYEDSNFHLKDVKAYAHELGSSDEIITEVVLSNSNGTFFELYGESNKIIDKVYIRGNKVSPRQEKICITDMILLEPINK